jgi:hypothetical protein
MKVRTRVKSKSAHLIEHLYLTGEWVNKADVGSASKANERRVKTK